MKGAKGHIPSDQKMEYLFRERSIKAFRDWVQDGGTTPSKTDLDRILDALGEYQSLLEKHGPATKVSNRPRDDDKRYRLFQRIYELRARGVKPSPSIEQACAEQDFGFSGQSEKVKGWFQKGRHTQQRRNAKRGVSIMFEAQRRERLQAQRMRQLLTTRLTAAGSINPPNK